MERPVNHHDRIGTVARVTHIVDLAAHELSSAIHRRDVSCRDVMAAYLDRIESVNPLCNAIVSLGDRDELMQEANEHDELLVSGRPTGWMHGFPHAVKDLIDAAGYPTTSGSPVFRSFRPQHDSLLVERMRADGCIVIGKTNVPEFGLGSHTFNDVFGTTTNPYDPTRAAGGSSGGAAVGLTTHMLPVADGSDFGGSLRNPAGWNNVFGFRPSQGRVPGWPRADAYVAQLATEGPMGRTVRDVAMLLSTIAGPDPRNPLALADHADYVPLSNRRTGRTAAMSGERWTVDLDSMDPAGIRVGWLGDLGGHLPMDDGVLATCEAALRRIEGLGCIVEPATLGWSPEHVWNAVWLPWRRWLVGTGIADVIAAAGGDRSRVKAEALWEHDTSTHMTADDCVRASRARTEFAVHVTTDLFDRFDVLALPTAQVWPFDATQRWPASIGGRSMDTYHRWMEVVTYATLCGLPAISVPAGFGGPTGALPMGLQLIGPPRADRFVLQLAHAYELASADVVGRRPAEPS